MTKTVCITTGNYDSATDERIDPALAVVAMGEQAFPTSRVLDGSSDHGYAQEWKEAATLPDGSACYRVYLFDETEVTDEDGEAIDAENYPWDDDHVARIILADE